MVTILIILYFISSITNSKNVVLMFGVFFSFLLYPISFLLISILAFIVHRYSRFLSNRELLMAVVCIFIISFKNTFLSELCREEILGLSFALFQVCYYVKSDMSHFSMIERLGFFPQLYCGPVVKPSGFTRSKKLNIKSLALHHIIFSLGLFYKSYLVYITHYVYLNDDSVLNSIYWFAYMYSDFLSWSLMGIGIAGLSGFKMPISFKSPFFSKNISQFYQSWNITIYLWCIDFIKFKSSLKYRAYVKIGVVAGSLALWHGIGFNFILFGLFNFVYFLFQNKIKKFNKILWVSQFFFYASVGFVFTGRIPCGVFSYIPINYTISWICSVLIVLFVDYKSLKLVKYIIRKSPVISIVLCLIFVSFTFFFRKIDGQFYYAQF